MGKNSRAVSKSSGSHCRRPVFCVNTSPPHLRQSKWNATRMTATVATMAATPRKACHQATLAMADVGEEKRKNNGVESRGYPQ